MKIKYDMYVSVTSAVVECPHVFLLFFLKEVCLHTCGTNSQATEVRCPAKIFGGMREGEKGGVDGFGGSYLRTGV